MTAVDENSAGTGRQNQAWAEFDRVITGIDPSTARLGSCRDELFERSALVLINSFGPAFVKVDQFAMIDAHQVQDRGMNVVNMQTIFHCMQSQFISRSIGMT